MNESLFQRLGLSLAIGFLIGVERGWKQRTEAPGDRTAGLRTYALIGLLGGIGAVIGETIAPLAFAAIALGFAGLFGAFMWRAATADEEYSATGAIAGLVTFALGALAATGSTMAASAAAVATVLVLAFKETLHSWLRALTWQEIRSALLILAMSFIALPLLPSGPVDPWGLVNARELWLMTILIATASFGGYVSVRIFGARTGLALGAAAGAIVSSTVVTLDLARRVAAKEAAALDASSGAAIASAVMLTRIGLLSLVLSPPIFRGLMIPLAAAILAAALAAIALFLADGFRGGANSLTALRNPLDLRAVFRFAAILAALSVLAQVAMRSFGQSAILPFAALSGLIDVDAVVLALSRLDGIAPSIAADAILLAAAMDTASKCAIAGFVGGRAFAGYFAAASGFTLAAAASTRLFLPIGSFS